MKVLVVGGAGYLGSVLCRDLLDKGYEVRVLDNLTYGFWGVYDLISNPDFEFITGDIRNLKSVMEAVKGVDAVIHLAGIVGDPASALSPEDTVEINHLSTQVIAEVCKYYNVERFIFASTCSVYGDSDTQGLLTEESLTNPLSLYAEMKLMSEKAIMEKANSIFSPTILRMGTLYGVSQRMRFDLVVNLFAINAVINRKLTLFGGEQKRCFCHVKDASDAYISCLESPIEKVNNQIFNVSTENLRIIDLAREVVERVHGAVLTIDEKKVDARSYITSSEKIRDLLDWSPVNNISGFVDEMIGAGDEWKDFNENPIYSNYEYLKLKGLTKIDAWEN